VEREKHAARSLPGKEGGKPQLLRRKQWEAGKDGGKGDEVEKEGSTVAERLVSLESPKGDAIEAKMKGAGHHTKR